MLWRSRFVVVQTRVSGCRKNFSGAIFFAVTHLWSSSGGIGFRSRLKKDRQQGICSRVFVCPVTQFSLADSSFPRPPVLSQFVFLFHSCCNLSSSHRRMCCRLL